MEAVYLVKLPWVRWAWDDWRWLVSPPESSEAWVGVKGGEARGLVLTLERFPIAATWPPYERSWPPS
jgi:hypothetical protein